MKGDKIKLITEILAIVVIVLVSFVGVYKQKYNMMENQVKGYKYSKDLDGYREIILEVSSKEENSEEKAEEENSDAQEENNDSENNEEKTENDNKYEDYKKAKGIIEKRLKSLGVQDYTISQNSENGSIYIQLAENDETDHVISDLAQVGKFIIKDSEDESKILLSNDNLKKVSASYNTSTNGTVVYLQFNFNKEGKEILKEISSNEYKTKEETTKSEEESSEEKNENSENSTNDTDTEENKSNNEETNQKKVTLAIDESTLITTSFDDAIENGAINLTMNKATTDTVSINDTLKSASTICSILNSGEMPLSYEIKENRYVQTDINKNQINKVYIALGVIFALALLILILKYNVTGVIAAIANIGFLALYLLVIRYTNVVVSLESIFAGIIVLIINYLIVNDFLKMDSNKKTIDIFKPQMFKVVPIVLIAIIFSFMKVTKLYTCGMFLFWGVLVSFIYNYTLTRYMLIRKEANIDEK